MNKKLTLAQTQLLNAIQTAPTLDEYKTKRFEKYKNDIAAGYALVPGLQLDDFHPQFFDTYIDRNGNVRVIANSASLRVLERAGYVTIIEEAPGRARPSKVKLLLS